MGSIKCSNNKINYLNKLESPPQQSYSPMVHHYPTKPSKFPLLFLLAFYQSYVFQLEQLNSQHVSSSVSPLYLTIVLEFIKSLNKQSNFYDSMQFLNAIQFLVKVRLVCSLTIHLKPFPCKHDKLQIHKGVFLKQVLQNKLLEGDYKEVLQFLHQLHDILTFAFHFIFMFTAPCQILQGMAPEEYRCEKLFPFFQEKGSTVLMLVSFEDGNYVNPCFAFGTSYYLWTIFIPGLFMTGFTIGLASLNEYQYVGPVQLNYLVLAAFLLFKTVSIYKFQKSQILYDRTYLNKQTKLNQDFKFNMKKKQQEKFQLNKLDQYSPNLQQKSSLFSWLFFLWTNTLIQKGFQKTLQTKDLSDLRQKQQPQYSHGIFFRLYNQKGSNFKGKIGTVIKQFIGGSFIMAGILSAISQSMLLMGPIMIKLILQFMEPNQNPQPLTNGIFYVTILLLSYIVRSILIQHATHKVNLNAAQIINALTSLIYEKILSISSSSRKYLQSGSILNYINVDCNAIYSFIILSPYLFTGPLMVITAIILLMFQVGIIGLLVPLLFLFGIYWQQKLLKKGFEMRKNQLQLLDKRSRCINQYFSGIRVIKYYGWENYIEMNIQNIRKEQIILNFSFLMIRTYIQMLMKMLPIIASIVVFGLYTNVYGTQQLTLAKAMSIMSIFNLITNPIRLMVSVSISYMNITVSLARIQHFCQFEQKQELFLSQNERQQIKMGQIKFEDCYFYWQTQIVKKHYRLMQKQQDFSYIKIKSKQEYSQFRNVSTSLVTNKQDKKIDMIEINKPLLDIQDQVQQYEMKQLKSQQEPAMIVKSLKISPGQFVAVVGRVASGKTTFLYTILGQIFKEKGRILKCGKIAYVPQVSWLKSTTIKENIIFQQEYNEQKYLDVIKLCQLQEDLKILPGGDLTQIGQKGLNLSGGQKQRISIARAVYSESDIYLIDDCLSALDSYVSKNIFKRVFKKYLKNKHKTIVFVTNSLNYTDFCDRILVVQKGQIVEDGYPQSLNKNQHSFYYNLKLKHKQLMKQQQQQKRKYRQSVQKRRQTSIDLSQFSYQSQEIIEEKKKKKFHGLVKVQQRIKGSIPWTFYLRFFSETKIITSVFLLIFILLCQFARIGSDWWLAHWTKKPDSQNKNYNLFVYSGICFLVCLLMFLRGLFFAKFIIRTSKTIHRKLIETLLKTPLSWFDVTPTGRILARTIKDQDDLDNMLPYNLQNSSQNILIILSSILLISAANPFYIIIAFISLYGYSILMRRYLTSSRQIKRLESNCRAPLLSHLQQTVNGIYVIRAFNKKHKFIKKFFARQKAFVVCLTNQNIAQRWINLVTDTFSILTIACAGYLAIINARGGQQDNSNTTMIGLALVWTIQMSSIMPYTIKTLADTQNNMNSLVRMYDYIDNNPSQKDFLKMRPLHPQWPSQGQYLIENVSYKYRPQLPYVIKNISFQIEPRSKIGIVGRTGCGKSSITLGLLRILQIYPNQDKTTGAIYLDQENVSNIGLHFLRHRISIIPQDPILFTGTIKSNIDPFGNYNDKQIEVSLKKVNLWDLIPNQPGFTDQIDKKLNSKVEEAGSNYSLGQKQLICMARALIRKPKVLIMDEATASIDQKSDEAIQKMIRDQFKESTVITIAHRLNTLIYYDKILVLDNGQIMEYDTPLTLVKNQYSFLGKLIRKTGYTYMNGIIDLAQKSFQAKQKQKKQKEQRINDHLS